VLIISSSPVYMLGCLEVNNCMDTSAFPEPIRSGYPPIHTEELQYRYIISIISYVSF
jgi:hypothetical protein